jgi:hypothetical protein
MNLGQVLQGPEVFSNHRVLNSLVSLSRILVESPGNCLNELSWKRHYKYNTWVDKTQPKQPDFFLEEQYSSHNMIFLGMTLCAPKMMVRGA